MVRRSFLVALCGAVVLATPGCGGPMQPQELARSVQTLESSAAEGALLANGVARDRTKATFVRAHSRDLGETVDHEAEKLADADANGEVAVRKSQRSEEHTSELQSLTNLVCRLLLEKK